MISYPLVENNILSIGFSQFADTAFVKAVFDANNEKDARQVYEAEFKKQKHSNFYKSLGRYNHLWHFIFSMKKDDRVVVPLQGGLFSVYKLLTNQPLIPAELDADLLRKIGGDGKPIRVNDDGHLCEGDNANIIDLGFFREVEPIAVNIERSKYADASLISRMKARQTTLEISDLKCSVERAIEGEKNNSPINLYADIISDSAPKVLESIKNDLYPKKFERLIEWYFERIGATNASILPQKEPGKSGDADILAYFKPLRTTIYVQAKHFKGEAGGWAVEQITKYIAYIIDQKQESQDETGTQIGWVISSADEYSEEAIKNARENNIELIDGLEFATMLLEAGIADLNLDD